MKWIKAYNISEETLKRFYELEYKIDQLKRRNPQHPKLYKWKNKLNTITDKFLTFIHNTLISHIEINVASGVCPWITYYVDKKSYDDLAELNDKSFNKIKKEVEETLDRKIEGEGNSLSNEAEDPWIFTNMMLDTAEKAQMAKKAKNKSLNDKIIKTHELLQWYHASGGMKEYVSDALNISLNLLDKLSEGEFNDKWDKDLQKIAKKGEKNNEMDRKYKFSRKST